MDVGAAFWPFLADPDENGCREWLRGKDSSGYGMTRVRHPTGRGRLRAHQVAWLIARGRLPATGLTLDHLCRNRPCAEITHLEAVDRGENVRRGGIFRRQERCIRGHLLAETRTPKGCRACKSAREREKTAAYRADHPVEPFRRAVCRAGLHPLIEGNLHIDPTGKRQCLACRKARIRRQVEVRRQRRAA